MNKIEQIKYRNRGAGYGDVLIAINDINYLLSEVKRLAAECARLTALVNDTTAELESEKTNPPIELSGDAAKSFVLALELSEVKQELKKYKHVERIVKFGKWMETRPK